MVDTEELKDEERAEAAEAVPCEEEEAVPCEEAAGEAADAAAEATADGEADEAVAGEDVADGEAAESDDADADAAEEELYEIEVAEDDIYAYIVDEDDNEIGFILLDENGEEQECYYADDDTEGDAPAKDDEYDFGITREGVAEATSDMNAIYKDGVEIAAEFKGAFDDIMDGFSFLKKK